MPLDCGFLCLFSDRRRFCEILWRRRLLITQDEKKAKRRFLSLMRGFDSEDLDVLRRAIESNGRDIKQCAPGPPMDLVEEADDDSDSELDDHSALPAGGGDAAARVAGCSTTIVSTRPRHSINRLERDRVLFQRQKFPAAPPPPATADTPRQYSHRSQPGSGRRRVSSSASRTRHHQEQNANYDAAVAQTSFGHSRSATPVGSEGEDGAGGGEWRQPTLPDEAASHGDSGLIPQIDRPMSLPYLCCKLWRWRDLQIDAALHRLDPLPWCRFGRVTINNATVSCCNPYHYALWTRPEHSSSSSSADGADTARQLHEGGTLANGGHLLGLTANEFAEEALADPLRQQRAPGHVRSTFRCMHETLNANATIAATLVNNAATDDSDSDGEGEDAPPLAPPPPVPMAMDYSPASPTRPMSPTMHALVNHVAVSAHSQAIAWGRMARWERKERVGEVVALVGEFVAVGRLAGTVFDGQDVRCAWDAENHSSFALIRQAEGLDAGEDVWLYNSGERPLFLSTSRTLSSQQRSDAIRRLSPGYCIRVHRAQPAGASVFGGVPGNAFFSRRSTTEAAIDQLHRRATLASVVAEPTPAAASSSAMGSVSFLTISVGVGWGANYQRLYVTDMPCRYEIIFT